ncbi:MAG: hypothetical protein ACLRXC_08655 [[Clostridium] leptum]
MDDMRPLARRGGLLPRVHGSGMFTRARPRCSPWPNGPIRDNQLLDGIDEEETKRYIHLQLPSYSVGR